MTARHPFVVTATLLLLTTALQAETRFISGATVSPDGDSAAVSIQFACRVQYVDHLPRTHGNRLRIRIDATSMCAGNAPTVAATREQYRPLNADVANLLEIDYDGERFGEQALTLVFNDNMNYVVSYDAVRNRIDVRVRVTDSSITAPPTANNTPATRVQHNTAPGPDYVINLSSSRSPHADADKSVAVLADNLRLFETEVELAGVSWYRLRIGAFKSADAARQFLRQFESRFPNAWVDIARNEGNDAATSAVVAEPAYEPSAVLAGLGLDEVDQLMADARRAMAADERSRAVQLYTKVLRAPNHDRHAQAQEYLALARERSGQTAHAKAEYQRYLSRYPDGDGADRVRQRLAALLASSRPETAVTTPAGSSKRSAQQRHEWRINTFLSQYYRRDANQLNEEEEIVSQSALYTDINFDARRRGERFDFSGRFTGGYRKDFLDDDPDNEVRISYAYVDVADAISGFRGRLGRQSRNTGGVLGRFDGLHASYRASERILVSAVGGQPVNSASDGLESEKSFYGISVDYGPIIDALEMSLFYIRQDIDGIEDRAAVGAEFRYFADTKSLWGLIDYDTSFNELSSAYLQGSWRIGSRLSLSGALDRRHSPYLSTGSALIGQPVQSFAELRVLMTEDEIRALSLDRSPLSNSYTLGASYSISPRLQLNVDANHTTVDAAPESGGVPTVAESNYDYVSGTLVSSSLFKEGDVMMLGLRWSKSESTRVSTVQLDNRLPIGKRWRINARLRIDQRRIMVDSSDEYLYTPSLRVQYRHNRKFRVELEAGKQFAERQLAGTDLDRETYYVNLGYQAFF